MESFLTRFQWDSAKFPLRQPLPNIVEGISKVTDCAQNIPDLFISVYSKQYMTLCELHFLKSLGISLTLYKINVENTYTLKMFLSL